jgi:hypothetical protein
LRFSHLEPYLSFFLLDGPENSRCVLLGRVHICTLGIDFCEVGKDEEGGCQTIREGFFSFCQKIKDEKAGWQTVGDSIIANFIWSNRIFIDVYTYI